MRIEINAGGMGKISVLSFEEAVAQSIAVTASVIDSFVEIENDTYALNGGVGDCQDAVDSIGARIQEEADRLDEELAFHREVEDFIALAIRVDNEVANELGDAKNEFYQMYPWAKPPVPEEKSWLDHLIEGLKGAAEFLANLAESVVDTIINGISDFVEKNKEIISTILNLLGTVLCIASVVAAIVVMIFVLPVVSGAAAVAIAIIAAGGVAALAALGTFAYGMSAEVYENGGNFANYDMRSVLIASGKVFIEQFVTNLVSFLSAKFIGDAIKGKLTTKIFNPTSLSFGKRLAVNTLYAWPGEVTQNLLTNIAEDVVDGDGLNLIEDISSAFSVKELISSFFMAAAQETVSELTGMLKYLKQAQAMDVSTPQDAATFYSGKLEFNDGTIHSSSIARGLAENSGKMTIEMTEGGKFFDDLKLYERYPKVFADEIWQTLSKRYADAAFGEITVLTWDVSLDSVFINIETPKILEGIDTGRITDIIFPELSLI